MYRDRVNEKLPTEYLLHEFDELISCKSLGSYNCCEMVSIYLCQREKEMPDNVYTIFVFETRPNVEKSSERLLKKLKSITDMCCAFFYDITQIFYIVLAGQEKQIIEADESVTQSIRKIQLFIRRHEDYWKDHVKQKIELEHRLEAML